MSSTDQTVLDSANNKIKPEDIVINPATQPTIVDKTIDNNLSNDVAPKIDYTLLLKAIENAAKDNTFANKEEFYSYIQKQQIPEDILTKERITELLNIYDENHKITSEDVDLSNYKSINLEGDNHKSTYIADKDNDKVIKFEGTNSEVPDEFRNVQNKISNGSNLADSNQVFEYMRNHEKVEVSLVPIYEISKDNVTDNEILNKIRFFVQNNTLDTSFPYEVNPETGVIYNTTTDEMYEVRKNEQTGQYEIIKGGSVVYEETSQSNVSEETDEKSLAKNKPYVKVREMNKTPDTELDDAAFTKGPLLIAIGLIIIIASISVLLLLK